MDHKEAHHLRLYVLAALFFIVAAVYIGVLYDTQVNNYDYYYASSVRSIARSETVEAARGNITDRNGKVLVSSRSSYNLTFDASLLEKDEDANESLPAAAAAVSEPGDQLGGFSAHLPLRPLRLHHRLPGQRGQEPLSPI